MAWPVLQRPRGSHPALCNLATVPCVASKSCRFTSRMCHLLQFAVRFQSLGKWLRCLYRSGPSCKVLPSSLSPSLVLGLSGCRLHPLPLPCIIQTLWLCSFCTFGLPSYCTWFLSQLHIVQLSLDASTLDSARCPCLCLWLCSPIYLQQPFPFTVPRSSFSFPFLFILFFSFSCVVLSQERTFFPVLH